MSDTYAVVNSTTGLVVNLIAWDGSPIWSPSPGFQAIDVAGLFPSPGVGWTNNPVGSTTFISPPPPAPTPNQQYATQLALGMVLTSTSTPAVNATYTTPVPNGPAQNAAAQANITSIETSIAAGRGLPGGGATFNYYDHTGASHAFNATNWGNAATVFMNYSYALQGWYLGGCVGSPPSNQLTIA